MVTAVVVPAALAGRGVAWLGQKFGPLIGGAMMWTAGRFQHRYIQLESRYVGLIRPALARPTTVLGVAIVSFVLAIVLGSTLSQTLIPEVHQGRFTVEASWPVGCR